MKITTIQYGKSVLSERFCFRGGDGDKDRDIVFKIYLVEMGDKKILVDAGCETMPGFVMEDFIGTVKALENTGFSPDEITDVVITHAHHDHIECVKCFENALIHIQQDEYEKGRKYIPDHFSVNVFEDEFDIAENVKVIKIGGHTKGSCIVQIEDGETYVIAGDECYLRENLLNCIPTGSSFDREASKFFVEKYSSDKYTVLLCHDEGE